MNVIAQVAPVDATASIREETGGKLKSFLYELAEGVTTYRTVHSLTEQVQHQYHGRFAIELIQNAYDALTRDPHIRESQGRIEMRLVMDGGAGTLYVANDGAPFSESNFRSVSRLGQSDKNPETSIGNKGIGFRSVLEISRHPRIWSRRAKSSTTFDGYCFGFDPAFVSSIYDPIVALLHKQNLPTESRWFGGLVDWDESWFDRLRVGIHRQAAIEGLSETEWLRAQIGYLSPYLLPWPLTGQVRPEAVDEFEANGFSTVLALPLTSPTSAKLVEQKLAAIDDTSLLFLDNLQELTLSVPEESRTFSRSVARAASGPRRLGEIVIGAERQPRHFRTWSREFLVQDMPDAVHASIEALPGHWPNLSRAEITLSVGSSDKPESGRLSIFLPTKLETGASVHINAPFFGDMSRTTISFAEDAEDAQAGGVYNSFLLRQAADLALEAITADLHGGTSQDAADILDILAPNGTDAAAIARWKEHLCAAAAAKGLSIPDSPWALSDQGWTTLAETSLLPLAAEPKVLSAEVMRKHATFPVYVAELDGRDEQIQSLSDSYGIGALPAPEDQALTIERAAKALAASGESDWGGFWEEVCQILDNNLSALREREVLLCTDGALHAGGLTGRAIYFRPRQSGGEEEGPEEQAIDQIPAALQPFIAILDPAIPVTEVSAGRRQNTKLHKLLTDAGLVDSFRREEVLTDVLIPNLPATPVRHNTPEVALCRDTLVYALRLAQSMEARGDGQGLLKALAKLPVPCHGGWFTLSTAVFGLGWPQTKGQIVTHYLRLAKSVSARAVRDRLLRTPDHSDWGGLGPAIRNILRDAGVYDGLPLLEIGGKEPAFSLVSWNYRFHMPSAGPVPIDDQTWSKFSSTVADLTSHYKSGTYKAEKLYWLPGMESYAEFNEAARRAFFTVVLHSAPQWPGAWGQTTFTRTTGTYEVKETASPLMVALRTWDWFPGLDNAEESGWSVPSDRWLVPSRHIARGRAWTLEHLSPLSSEISAMVEQNQSLGGFLRSIGVPVYEPDRETDDPRLLDSLSETAERNSYRNKDVFIGQLRAAWDAFAPASAAVFPAKIVIQQPTGNLASVRPSEDSPVYLPSERIPAAALRDLGLSVIAIEPKAARRLADDFSSAYGGGVRHSEHFEMAALSGDVPWKDDNSDLLSKFDALDGAIPFLLTIAAFHGSNAQGTASNSFNDLVRELREARVAIVPELSIVPMIGEREIASPQRQIAAWLARKRILVLDAEWDTDIEAVADSFTHLLGRSDLRFQNRKGLSEIWRSDDDHALEDILRQMDLTVEHYRGVLELWRGDLGPLIARLSILFHVLGRSDLSARLERAEQREQILPVLREGLHTDEDAEVVLRSAINSRNIFQFGCEIREVLGPKVELCEWNNELTRLGETSLSNPNSDAQFTRHKEQALPAFRRIVATLSARVPGTPSFSDGMKRVDVLRCAVSVARDYWEVPFAEVTRAVGQELKAAGFPDAICTMAGGISAPAQLASDTNANFGFVVEDPVEIAAANRRYFGAAFEQIKLILTAWYANIGKDQNSSWVASFIVDPATSLRHEDRDFYTRIWDDKRILAFTSENLPAFVSQEIREKLAAAGAVDDLMASLQILPEQIRGAEDALAALNAEEVRRKRLVQVCGADIENTETGLSGLFAHIAAQIGDEALKALAGFDIETALIPKKLKKTPRGTHRKPGTRTKAPRRASRNMEDLVGAAGEIHAFRWLQLRYGSTVITPSNWVSAYSAKTYPDNAMNVDEGRGCDIFFTFDGCTYDIEIKASDGEATSFMLGTSEIRRAREVAARKHRKPREEFLILKVDNALSTAPVFTLLPNPYDPRYQDRFDIVDDGARVSYRA